MKDKKSTKLLLLQEAINQFSENGFNKTSIRDLCSKLNITIAAVNYHYNNKNYLIEAVVEHAFERFIFVIKESESLANSNFKEFLKLYSEKLQCLDKEILLIFRDLFQNVNNNKIINERINSIKSTLAQTALSIAHDDKSFDINNEEEFKLQLEIFSSVVSIEAIKRSLTDTYISRENYEEWILKNINIIFK